MTPITDTSVLKATGLVSAEEMKNSWDKFLTELKKDELKKAAVSTVTKTPVIGGGTVTAGLPMSGHGIHVDYFDTSEARREELIKQLEWAFDQLITFEKRAEALAGIKSDEPAYTRAAMELELMEYLKKTPSWKIEKTYSRP